MKRFLLYLFAITTFAACSKSDDVGGGNNNNNETPKQPEITLNATASNFASDGGSSEITFTTSAAWTAEVINTRADAWCSVNPTSGAAGDAKIIVTTTANDTPDNRSASIVIKAGTASKTITVSQKQKDALTVTASKFEVGAEGSEVSIEVKANIDFEYAIEESAKGWVEYKTTRALKTSNLVFDVKENDDTEKREAKITIKSGEFSEDITIYQAGAEPTIVISQNEYVVSSDGDTIAVDVASNVDVAIELPAEVDWVTENTTRGVSTNTYYFDVAPSEEYDQRTAEIKFTNKENNLSEVVKIVQTQMDAIVLAKSEYEFGTDGGNLDFEIQTNVDVTVTISDDAKDWIQQVETRGLEKKALYFDVKSCSTEDDREGTITISGGDATQVIVVKQFGLKQTLEKERKALIEFYKATGGDNWTNNTNWCSDKPVSEWYGVRVNNNGTVRKLDLGWNNLVGYIPEDICDLTTIKEINFYENQLFGQIPENICDLTSLSHINFYGNQLSGQIPENIGNLTSLEVLSIGYNLLTGSIPESIGSCTLIEVLCLDYNQLSGHLPESMGNLTKIDYLVLEGNRLSGEVSHIINRFTNLKDLWLHGGNSFTGPLPEYHENMTYYNVTGNLFTGGIPDSHIRAFEKNESSQYGHYYDISCNNLSGDIPAAMVSHESWVAHWREILPQNSGYGFNRVDIKAPQNVVKCFDDSFLDLAKEYKSNQYTIVFRWDAYCYWSYQYVEPIYKLYNKYKDKGLGMVCATLGKHSVDEIAPLTSVCKDVKVFCEMDNNPYSLGYYFFLFRTGVTPYFHIIDNNGNIVFYGSGDVGHETVPQYHENRDDIYDFVANLFGDEKYEEEKEYESTDYSRDGEVKQLQTASKGDGIDLVLMGDAYSDRLIADGTYDQVMQTAMEKFFEVEPYKSFRDHFNVYSVTAVSKNEFYTNTSETAFAGYFGSGTYVGGNNQRAFYFAQKAIGEERVEDALVVVMMNSTAYAGTCYIYSPSYGDWGNGATVAYFPVGKDEDALAQVLHHEAGGHGFTKLGDEYSYENMGEIPALEIEDVKALSVYGWRKNVDFTSDPTKVKWSHFLADERYANDGLGVYEGALRYWTGAYRPTMNSIMNANVGGFNAPSREAIYYRIHKLAYGADWKYDYEEFVEWDAKNRATTTRGVPYRLEIPEDFKPLHPPVVMMKSWKEATNNAPKKTVTRSSGNAGSNLQKVISPSGTTYTFKPTNASASYTTSNGRTVTVTTDVSGMSRTGYNNRTKK